MSKAEGAAAGAAQMPGMPRPLLYSEPLSVCRRFETRSVCSGNERVPTAEARGGHKRADHMKGRAFDSSDTSCVCVASAQRAAQRTTVGSSADH